jgi:hypothetical protein
MLGNGKIIRLYNMNKDVSKVGLKIFVEFDKFKENKNFKVTK